MKCTPSLANLIVERARPRYLQSPRPVTAVSCRFRRGPRGLFGKKPGRPWGFAGNGSDAHIGAVGLKRPLLALEVFIEFLCKRILLSRGPNLLVCESFFPLAVLWSGRRPGSHPVANERNPPTGQSAQTRKSPFSFPWELLGPTGRTIP